MNPSFEYDAGKSSNNHAQHGIDFEQAQVLWSTKHVIIPAKRVGDETRYFIVGKMHGRLYVAVFAYRGLTIRLISCHRADNRLEKIYEREAYEAEES